VALNDQVLAASMPRETKADIIAYYQAVYPAKGKGSWKQRLVNDLAGITGLKPKNLEKRFDTQRRGNPELRNAAQYQELGDQLPPKAPEGGFHISGVVYVNYSDGCEERYIDIEVKGGDAEKLVLMAAQEQADQGVVNAYNELDVDEKQGYLSCADSELDVEPIE
jgi:hypothetical protein